MSIRPETSHSINISHTLPIFTYFIARSNTEYTTKTKTNKKYVNNNTIKYKIQNMQKIWIATWLDTFTYTHSALYSNIIII